MKSFFYGGDPESLISPLLRLSVQKYFFNSTMVSLKKNLLPLYKVLYDQQIGCTALKYCHF